MPRTIWKGSISFGLVHIPVALYSGEENEELGLTMLDKRDMSPIGYKRVNKNTGKEVSWDDIVKGYEYEEGEYVVLDEDDFMKANVEATQTIEILCFVNVADVPVLYFSKPYFLEPIRKGEKGYALLREILKQTGKMGIAKVVLRTRQHLAGLVVQNDLLVLDLLRYHHELRGTEELKIPGNNLSELKISKKEVEMAQRLVEDMVESWNPENYHDDYRDDLLQLIEQKAKAGETEVIEKPVSEEIPKGAEIIDLMSLLKRSVDEKEKKERTQRKSTAAQTKTGRSKRGYPKRAKG